MKGINKKGMPVAVSNTSNYLRSRVGFLGKKICSLTKKTYLFRAKKILNT